MLVIVIMNKEYRLTKFDLFHFHLKAILWKAFNNNNYIHNFNTEKKSYIIRNVQTLSLTDKEEHSHRVATQYN